MNTLACAEHSEAQLLGSINDQSRFEFFPLFIRGFGDGNFRVMRWGGKAVIATRRTGVEAIQMLRNGLSIGEVRRALASRHQSENSSVSLEPLLATALEAGLIRSIDGTRLHNKRPTLREYLHFAFRSYFSPRLAKAGANTLPPRLLYSTLYHMYWLQLRRPLRSKLGAATKGMRRFLSHKSQGEIKALRRDYFRHLIRNIVDVDMLMVGSPKRSYDWLLRNSDCSGLEHLDRALDKKSGVILCTYHFSSARLIAPILMVHGYSTSIGGAANIGLGIETIHRRIAQCSSVTKSGATFRVINAFDVQNIKQIIGRLRQGEIVMWLPDAYSIPIDQDAQVRKRADYFGIKRSSFPRSKVAVTFFQRQLHMNESVGWLAAVSGATILPAFIVRDAARKLHLKIEPPIVQDEFANWDRDSKMTALNLEIYRLLEARVSEYPAQWYVWHNLEKLESDDGSLSTLSGGRGV
jgi:lauroyl/myristoyl acyltransferase